MLDAGYSFDMMALMLNFKVLGFWIKEVLQLYNLI
jgi:hypothetical protein